MSYLYPRLPLATATSVYEEFMETFKGRNLSGLRDRSALAHDMAVPAATGGKPVPESALVAVQEAVRDLVQSCGWPDEPDEKNRQRFDAECPRILGETMGIIPADAGADGVWTFMTLVLLPEVPPWRWPSWNQRRFLEHPRNTFRNLFWRGYVLGTVKDGMLGRLGEDELTAVLERPSLSADPTTAWLIFDVYLSVLDRLGGVQRMLLMRDYAKRLRRLTPFLSLDSMDSDDLRNLCADMLDAALAAVGSPVLANRKP
jgi:hypothetical protein